ncbi:hypothetical protein LEP1GSC170_0802, partial [Leptospira interrogans serovar Bataviae str. HAI135]
FILFLYFIIPLEAHHTGMGGSDQSSTRFVDPFTGKREKPANYVVLTQDFFKQTNENSNIHTSTFFGEINLKNGMFALNLSVPYTYYEQKDRSDAARIGKSYIGIKYLPLVDFQKNYFIVFSANVGFPSGPDTDKFTGGNYYSGIPGLTFGYLLGKFSFVGKVSGIFPLSKLQPSNLQDNDGIVYWLRNPSSPPPEETYLLKKTSLFSGYVTYLWKPGLSFLPVFIIELLTKVWILKDQVKERFLPSLEKSALVFLQTSRKNSTSIFPIVILFTEEKIIDCMTMRLPQQSQLKFQN